jgi:hypothetical protein
LNDLGEFVKITNIDFEKTIVQTYNLKSVSKYNNFFANGFLAHNKGGSPRKTYNINITKEGVAVGLTRRDRAVFDFNKKQYVAEAVSVAQTSSTLTLDSKSYVFNTGDELTFDLDKDGEEDISITLNEIKLGRATYIFKLAQEEEPFLPTITTTAPTTITTEEASRPRLPGLFREDVEETPGVGGATMFFKKIIKSPYLKYIGMGLVILVLAIGVISGITNKDKIILFFKKKKKNNNKKSKKKK